MTSASTDSPRMQVLVTWLLLPVLLNLTGCQSPAGPSGKAALHSDNGVSPSQSAAEVPPFRPDFGSVIQTAFPGDEQTAPEQSGATDHSLEPHPGGLTVETPSEDTEQNELPRLESLAASSNPRLMSLLQQANAASARTQYVDRLPDPTFGASVFGHPIETAAGSQRANLTVTQMIPWMDRLDAQQQQACFEAMALRQQYAAERLRVIAEVRRRYYRLYVLTRQIETVEASQQLLQTLIDIATARVATGNAAQGDVLLATLEYSRLEEQLVSLRQRRRSTEAGLNQLVSRPSATPVTVPTQLKLTEPSWSHELLVQTAWERQPLIAAAQLQANATRWGVDVANLRRRPDFQLGASWFFMDDNRPSTPVVDVGRDAWSIGATVTIPLDHGKYDAIRDEALWKHASSASAVREIRQEFDARLLDLLEQATAAARTAELYQETMIPQSEQTLAADQESLTNGTVEFDRVIQDFRNLLTLEFGYHRTVGDLAVAIAGIQQATGFDPGPASRRQKRL